MNGISLAGSRGDNLRRHLDDIDDEATRRSIRRQVRIVIGCMLLLVAVFVSATVHAILSINEMSVDTERRNVEYAVGQLIQSGAQPSNTAVRTLAEQLSLDAARLATPEGVASHEVAVPLNAAGDMVVAWRPRRLGTETFIRIAPIRVAAALAIVTGVILILYRLAALARHIDARRIEARKLAVRDPVTGLDNRLAFNDGLARYIDPATGDGRGALLLLDLDDFKNVNDRFGHIAGDQLLQEVAQRLKAHAAPEDAVARLGGDEFAIVRRNGLTRRELAEFAEGLVRLLSAPYRIEGHLAAVSVSIGIARIGAAPDAETVVRAADAALYRAKAQPGGAYEFEALPSHPVRQDAA